MKLTIVVACILLCMAGNAQIKTQGQPVHIFVGKSIKINMESPITRVTSSNPGVVDTVVPTPKQIVIEGKATGQSSLTLWDDQGHSQILDVTVGAANAQTGLENLTDRPVAGQLVEWHRTCDEVFGAVTTMPGVKQVESPYKVPDDYTITVPFDGQDTPPGKDTLVELGYAKDQEVCWMKFPMPYPYLGNRKLQDNVWLEEREWICQVADLGLGQCPDGWRDGWRHHQEQELKSKKDAAEFQKTSMMDLKRIAAEAGY